MRGSPKLYLVTRRDLPAGQQAVQAAHALRAFVDAHPSIDRAWYRESRTLVMLAAPDEPALMALASEAAARGVPVAPHHEPDHGGALGAIALGPEASSLVRRIPLALAASAP
jgi:peptidyl-tRNA hydrolase